MDDSEKSDEAKRETYLSPGSANQDNNSDIVFYYSREHRLSNASDALRELNDGKPIRPSLRKTIFATRGNIVLFIAIVIICLVAGLTFRPSEKQATLKLGGNTVTVVILNCEGVLILGMDKKSPKNGEAYSGVVDIAVSPVFTAAKKGETQDIPPLFNNRIFFTPQEAESYQITLPFGGTNFLILLRTENEMKTLKLTASEGK